MDGSYFVYDMDDFERAFSLAAMTHDQILRGLNSCHTILTELNAKTVPNNILIDIQRKYM
jgi:predicted RNA-binding protein associated with RNAse of E/G family